MNSGGCMAAQELRLELDYRDAIAQDILFNARPPEAMAAAPVAPARGAMQLVGEYKILPGGWQRKVGAHWRVCGMLGTIVAQAHRRHIEKGRDPADFTAPFTDAQIEVAGLYRTLVEWRAGSAIKCASVEAGRGGGGAEGVKGYMETFIETGERLASMQRAVGAGMSLSPRRHMDRDNARRSLPDLVLVNLVVVHDMDLSAVLRRYGWAEKGAYRAELRGALQAALDRMRCVSSI